MSRLDELSPVHQLQISADSVQGPVVQRRSEARGVRTHRAALARGGKRAKTVFKNSRENSDCMISYVFACNKNKALQLQRVPILSILGLWLRPVRLCWYYANFVSGPVYSEY